VQRRDDVISVPVFKEMAGECLIVFRLPLEVRVVLGGEFCNNTESLTDSCGAWNGI